MDLTTQRRFLTTLTVGFVAVAVAGVVWSFGSIDESVEQASGGIGRQSTMPDGAAERSADSRDPHTDTADFSLSMQKSLYDQPKPKPQPPRPQPVVARQPKPPKVKQARLDWTLEGTIIDSDRSVAILTDASGKTDIRRKGEEVDLSPPGVLVRKIESDAVTLEISGRNSTLRLQQSFATGTSGNPDRPGRRRNR
jgi:type II secretory pathway component PulC